LYVRQLKQTAKNINFSNYSSSYSERYPLPFTSVNGYEHNPIYSCELKFVSVFLLPNLERKT